MNVKFRPQAKVPSGIFSRVSALKPECEDKLLYQAGNVLSYPGVLLTRLFVPREPTSGSQSLFAFYLARLFHGLLITLLLLRIWWLAQTTATGPPGLLALLLLVLSPLFVQQSFGVTIDVVCNAFALSVFTWLVFSERLRWFDYAAFAALGLVTAFGKPVLSVVLLPLLALGLCLERQRRDPGATAAIGRSLVEDLVRQRVFGLVVVAIVLAGVVYAQIHDSFSGSRATRQLAFASAEPWRAAEIVVSEIWRVCTHPRLFLDYLGYLETRIGAETMRDFGHLAVLVFGIEALGIGSGTMRLVRDPARRRALRPALVPIIALATLALAAVAASVLAIGVHAFFAFTAAGSERIASLQPRYLFPHGIVVLGVAAALARTHFGMNSAPEIAAPEGAGRLEKLGLAALLTLCAFLFASFAGHLAIALLQRYS